ncbi:hypothetical protein [Catenulispora pinisilvae]|uniref:hypothetical protein n=1 Tax=Catenulispora pinisilvae TaxID=2705253 RepID=UPI0018921645|nr:hypothetical protein [Catenulispora pinisilvae]
MAVAALVSAAVTGCGTSTKPSSLPQTPSTAAQATSQDPAGAAVVAAYDGMWSDYETDALTSNWQNPVSANHATGQALLTISNTLAVNGHHGWIVKGMPVLHPAVKSLAPTSNPSTADVVDCDDLSHFLKYVAATGALQDSTPGGWHLVQAGLVLKDGVWKVSTLAMGQAGSC